MISSILLAAGSSTRFGSPKALAKIEDTPLIVHLQRTLLSCQVAEIIVVLGDHYKKIKPHLLNHKKVKVVYNKDYNSGQTSSFKTGLRHICKEALGIMLVPVDVPAVKHQTINRLIEQFLITNPPILIPTYRSQKGHPPIFHIKVKNELMALDDSIGINSFQHRYREQALFLAVEDPGVVYSFNTPKEFAELKAYLKTTAESNLPA